MEEIKLIRKEYLDIKFIFDFADRFAKKMKDASLPEKTEETLTFQDYYDQELSHVPVYLVNRLLDYCYNEYFFKIVLSGSSFYKKVKKVCDELGIDPITYDLFFRSLFLAIKNRYYFDIDSTNDVKNDYNSTREIVYNLVLTSPCDAFENFPKINTEYYCVKAKLILKHLENKGLISFYQNDITQDVRLREYFYISCDTFKFSITDDKVNYDYSTPVLDFIDLRTYLENFNFDSAALKGKGNLLSRMEKAIQVVIVTSFKDARFHLNPFSDNSFLKVVIKQKKLYKKSKK